MTTIHAAPVVRAQAAPSAGETIKAETIQSAAAGGVAGLGAGVLLGVAMGGRYVLPHALAGGVVGGVTGLATGLARGGVDAATGDGFGASMAKGAAAVVGAGAGALGGIALASVVPGARSAINHGSGMGALYVAIYVGSASIASSLLVPPVLDAIGR